MSMNAMPPRSDALESAATKAVSAAVKARARAYARQPMRLEALYPGLAYAAPPTLLAVAEHLVERERRSPRRWFGFGGEVTIVNAEAALLLARAMRRRCNRDALDHESKCDNK